MVFIVLQFKPNLGIACRYKGTACHSQCCNYHLSCFDIQLSMHTTATSASFRDVARKPLMVSNLKLPATKSHRKCHHPKSCNSSMELVTISFLKKHNHHFSLSPLYTVAAITAAVPCPRKILSLLG